LPQLDKRSTRIGYASAILCAALVGSISTVSKPVLVNSSPLIYASFVYLLASLSSIPLGYKAEKSKVQKKDWPIILVITITGAVIAPILFFIGLKQTTASDTAILSNAETIFTVLFALIFFKERLRPLGYLAVVLVLIGVVIVTTNLQFTNFLSDIKKEGNLLIILSMGFWALDNNLSKIVTHRIKISKIVQLKGLIGGSIILIFAFLTGSSINISLVQIPNLLLVGIVGFGVSLYLFLHSLRRIGTVKTVLIYSTGTIFGLSFASTFLHEEIGVYQIVAVILMLFGIYIITKEGGQSVEKVHEK
jgi:drug/metabolite transporter (DMT)-like permease